MIPSDHFVRFYNETFKFLDERDGLPGFYLEISHHQEMHCLKLFQEKGLVGMHEYWSKIKKEENCVVTRSLYPDHTESRMFRCPSLSKVLDSDAEVCPKYCLHCFGWCAPLLEKAGYVYEQNIIAPLEPRCMSQIWKRSPEHPRSFTKCEPVDEEEWRRLEKEETGK